jgi:hypothetical protein
MMEAQDLPPLKPALSGEIPMGAFRVVADSGEVIYPSRLILPVFHQVGGVVHFVATAFLIGSGGLVATARHIFDLAS